MSNPRPSKNVAPHRRKIPRRIKPGYPVPFPYHYLCGRLAMIVVGWERAPQTDAAALYHEICAELYRIARALRDPEVARAVAGLETGTDADTPLSPKAAKAFWPFTKKAGGQ